MSSDDNDLEDRLRLRIYHQQDEINELKQKLESAQGKIAHLDQCNTEFIKIHNAQAAEIAELKRSSEFWRNDSLKHDRLYQDAKLQNRDLTEILEAAEGMFIHGSALNGTHATILRMKIEGYRGRNKPKDVPCPRCSYAMVKGLVCTKCGYVVEKRLCACSCHEYSLAADNGPIACCCSCAKEA